MSFKLLKESGNSSTQAIGPERPPVFRFGPFTLDPSKRQLLREQVPVKLYSREFDTLLTLVERRGTVVDKDELLRQVWRDAVVEEGNLTTHVSHLRKVLGGSAEHRDYIVTVPGRGYQFVAEVTRAPALEEAPPAVRPPRLRLQLAWLPLMAALILTAVLTIGPAGDPATGFKQLTFRRGTIWSARFAPDGETIVYGAAWDGAPVTLFSTRLGSPESRQHGPPADLLSISPSSELAISMNRQFESRWVGAGRLALLSLDGSEPRDLKRGTQDAEWANGTELVVIRRTATGAVLEYPSGSVVYQVRGFLMQPRVAPTNGDVAFLQRQSGDESVELVDRSGGHRTLVSGLSGVTGLAWSAPGTEVCYTATRGGSTAVYGVTRSGAQRRIMELAGEWTLNDVARNGRVLMTQHYVRGHTIVGTSGVERDFSWLDRSAAAALSDDGQLAILGEIGAGGGPGRSVYARRLDGSAAVRLGDGEPRALSPDGQWVVAIQEAAPERLVMLPTGGGDPKPLPNGRITDYYEVKWLADNRHIVLSGIEPGVDLRRYKQDVHGGAPQATGAVPSVYSTVFLPDGRYVGRGGGAST